MRQVHGLKKAIVQRLDSAGEVRSEQLAGGECLAMITGRSQQVIGLRRGTYDTRKQSL